jgi:hypothetical protein
MIKALPNGGCCYRIMAFDESKIASSLDSTHYKAVWQVAFGTIMGDPANVCFMDNVFVRDHKHGDTTNWSSPPIDGSKEIPEFTVFVAPLDWEAPSTFLDVSGCFDGSDLGSGRYIDQKSNVNHLIPNQPRYNEIWKNALTTELRNVLHPIYHRIFPNDIEDELETEPNNYLMTYATHMRVNTKGDWEVVYSNGLWKTISEDFYHVRYNNKMF